MKMTPYINLPGTCREALHFYAEHLGAQTLFQMTYDQVPDPKMMPPKLTGDSVLHATLSLGETQLHAADVPGAEPMRSAYLTLSVDSNEEAERIYAALTAGGQIFMKLQETFFAHRFAQFRDKFGVNWMLLHPRPMPPTA